MRSQKKEKVRLATMLIAVMLFNPATCVFAENEENFDADKNGVADNAVPELQKDEINIVEETENIVPAAVQSSLEEMKVEKLYADEECIKISFDTDSIGTFDDLTGITVSDENGNDVSVGNTVSEGGSLYLYPESKLMLDEVYEINVDAGVHSDTKSTTEKYTEKFIISLVYTEDFDAKTKGQGYYYSNIALTDIFEGKLWLWGYGSIGIGYDGISELENYTLSFDYTPYLATNVSSWLTSAPYTWIRYNTSEAAKSATKRDSGYGWRIMTGELTDWEINSSSGTTTKWNMPYAEAAVTLSSGSISNVNISKQANASRLKFSKTGADCSVYKDGELVVNYSPAERHGTDDTKGYFVVTSNENKVYQAVDNIRITTCQKAPEKEYFNVTSSYADVYGIKVVFDKDVSLLDMDLNDIKLSKSMEDVNLKSVKAEKNEIFITPQTKLEKDEGYTLYIKKGLGSKWKSLEKNYISSFKIKDYFNDDFDSYSSRGEGMEVIGNINFVGCRGGKIWMYYNSGFNFAVPGLEELEDYTLTFEYTPYNNNKKSENSAAPQTWVGYNLEKQTSPTAKNKGYGLTMYHTSLNFWENGKDAGNVKWNMPYCNADFEFYQSGEEGGVANAIKNISPVNGSEEVSSILTFSKHGSEMRIYKDGELVTDYRPTHITPAKTKGYFGFATPADRAAVNFYDNLNVTVTESVNNGSVAVAGVSCFDGGNNVVTAGNISAADKLSGVVRLANFSDEEKNVTAAVAVYGKDAELLRVQVLNINNVEANDMVDAEYLLDSLKGAQTVKLFVWDDEENYKLYQPVYKII